MKRLAGLMVLMLAGCAPAAPAVSDAPSQDPMGGLNLYNVTLGLGLDSARAVQAVPAMWDQATVSLMGPKLRVPLVRSIAASGSHLTAVFSVPPGPATVSVALGSGALWVATGSAALTLFAGYNEATVSLWTLLDFPGSVQ